MVGQKVPFLDPAFFLLGQFPEYFTQVLAQASIQHLAPTFWDKNSGQSHLKELAPGFGRTLLERHGKGAQRLLEMWQGLKPGLFLRAFSARLKSCPVTKLASVEFLRQTETLARHPNSNAIAL